MKPCSSRVKEILIFSLLGISLGARGAECPSIPASSIDIDDPSIKLPIISKDYANSIIINQKTQNYTSKENIRIRKEAIIRDVNFGKRMDLFVGGTATILVSVLTYKLVKFLLMNPEPKKIKCMSNRELTERLVALEKNFEKHKEPKLLGKRWFKSIGKSMLTSFVSSSLAGIGLKAFDKFYKRYHCFDSLTEFMEVRFAELAIIDELLYNAQLYDHHLNNANEKSTDLQAGKDRFIISLRNLVAHIEDIISFIEYRIDSFEYVALAQEDILIPNYLYESLKSYCSQVISILDGDSQETLFVTSANFRDDAIRFIESFKGLENRIAWLS